MYTKFPEANKLMQKYVDIIVRKVRNSTPGLKSIILSGGFGRGEGAVEFVNKKPRLINDIDMYLISKKQLSDHFLEELGKQCSRLIGKGGLEYPENYNMRYDFDTFFNVDFRCIKYNRIEYLPPTVRYFEMKNATTLLHGENIFPLIPEIASEDIPPSEGIRFLMNRMMSMFLSFKPEYLYEKPTRDEIGIVNYYIIKAYIACCEALLLLNGKYKPTYQGKNELFQDIYKKEFPDLYAKLPNLAKKVDFATKYKFQPDIKKINYKKEWFIARNHITEVFKYIISKVVKENPGSWLQLSRTINNKLPKYYFEDYSSFILKKFKLNIKPFRFILNKMMASTLSFLFFLRVKKELKKFYLKAFSFKDPGLKILSLTHLILLSVDEKGNFNPVYKDYIQKNLKSLYPINQINSWKTLKENYLDVFKLYYLRRFI